MCKRSMTVVFFSGMEGQRLRLKRSFQFFICNFFYSFIYLFKVQKFYSRTTNCAFNNALVRHIYTEKTFIYFFACSSIMNEVTKPQRQETRQCFLFVFLFKHHLMNISVNSWMKVLGPRFARQVSDEPFSSGLKIAAWAKLCWAEWRT